MWVEVQPPSLLQIPQAARGRHSCGPVALHYIIALKDTEHQKLTGLEMEWKTSVAERHPMSCFWGYQTQI
jgi:hypothetical protein